MGRPVTQDWIHELTFMQQSVVLSAIRGCDGVAKKHKHKPLVRWYRRCVLLSAFDRRALTDPFDGGGGSFTGPVFDLDGRYDGPGDLQGFRQTHGGRDPANDRELHDWRCDVMQKVSDDFMDSRDELPAHYFLHVMHAVEVLGYKHPDPGIRDFWYDFYVRMVHALHVWPETEAQMDARLGDDMAGWRARSDESCSCSD